jgi:hypothetical protein
MKCRDVQQWLLSQENGREGQRESGRIQNHLSMCRECAQFQQDLQFIRRTAGETKPEPSPGLVLLTYKRCRRLLDQQNYSARVPKIIWFSFSLIFILTLWFILPVPVLLQKEASDLTSLNPAPLILVIQNAVMLLFVPVILKKFRRRERCL